jgi:RNA 2',3'-cyclic 3'-phosphodiesterase
LFQVMILFSASGANQAGELFLAVPPDIETSRRIYRMAEILKKAHAFRGRMTMPERLHVTLLSLRGLSEQLIRTACSVIDEVRTEPFDISFDRSMSFRGRSGGRPFVLTGDEGLSRLKIFRRSLTAEFARRRGL